MATSLSILAGNGDGARAFLLRDLGDLCREGVALVGRGFLDIADIKHGLGGEQAKRSKELFLLGLALHQPGGLALAQQGRAALTRESVSFASLSAPLARFFERDHALFEAFEIGQHQFGLDRLDIGGGVHLAFHMGDVAILEAAHHMDDGVHLTDIGEELIAEPFALGRSAHDAGNIDEV